MQPVVREFQIMGFGNISIWQLLIVLLIVVVIFGTKKLRNMGSDVGGAVKNFRESMNGDDKEDLTPEALNDQRTAADNESEVHSEKTRAD